MTPDSTPAAKLDPHVQRVLAGLRLRIRLYVWVQVLAAVAVCLGGAFWASLALDWFFEPAAPIRILALGAVAVLLGIVVFRSILARAFVPLSDRNMAMLLERRFPELGDGLLTAVELVDCDLDAAGCNRAMLERTTRSAAASARQVRAGAVFNPAPLGRSVILAVVGGLSIAIFAALAPEATRVWARRSLLLSEELWPRQTRLAVVGFPGGRAKVARGADFEVRVRADVSMPRVPSTVDVYYRSEDGSAGRRSMNREGVARPGRDAFQEYSCMFQSVLAPMELDLVGGDARIRGLRLDVVENPTVEELLIECRYPDYTARGTRRLPVIGLMQIPVGTHVRLEGRANKDLLRVEIVSALEQGGSAPKSVAIAEHAADRRHFACDLGVLAADETWLVTLHDTDGIRSRQPLRVALAAVPDEAPKLAVQLAGIGTEITPKARLPVVGRASDDYGLARLWFEYAVDQHAPGEVPIATLEGNLTEYPVEAALDVRRLAVPGGVQPGGKLEMGLKAVDRSDLAGGPHVGTSQRWVLDVVTPERLQILLQSRELVLRQRFEMIIQEVTDTRDTLLQIQFEEAPASAGVAPEGVEPGAEPTDPRADSPERQRGVRLLRCQRAVDNCRKNAQETLGTAEAFDDVRLQLINNGIDKEEYKNRLGKGIAEPLRTLAEEEFPEWEKRLVALREALGDATLGPRRREEARRQADVILSVMNQVLARMIELEDFNEVIGILEEIIRAQKALGHRVQDRRNARLRDLQED